MAEISAFKRDANAMRDGAWINPGSEYGGIEIRCRALGYAYLDAVAAGRKRAAREAGGEERIRSETLAMINVEAMISTALIDVRGLNEGGAAVSFERFCDLVRDPAYGELTAVAFAACGQVGRQKAADMEDAQGNSGSASAPT